MTTKLQLSIAFAANPRTWPILDGAVGIDGVDLVCNVVYPSELFWRQLNFAEFDICEMSMSSLMMAIARGDDRFVCMPIFTTHKFFHTEILVRRDAGIETPADLKGKRVAVPEYQQTAALWTRGALQHEWGVKSEDMEWWMERPPSHSHGGALGFTPPPGVTLHYMPPEKNIGTMMASGEVQAAVHFLLHNMHNTNMIDRSTIDLWQHPAVRPIFPDPVAEGIRYYRKTGLYPINHGMVIKRSLYERHPWIVLNTLKAFIRANEIADEQRMKHVADHLVTGLIPPELKAALARPALQHGIRANRLVLETCAQYSCEQGLTPRVMKLEEIFAANTLAE